MIIDQRYRLDLHHEVMRMLWDDRLHESPLDQPHRILDIGTGTGIWAIEMADQYPMAEVIGTDLSPIQPEWVPANW
jgi:methylase of polypeptide subunit release factors